VKHQQKGTIAMTSSQYPSTAAMSEKGRVARIRTADPAEQAFMILRAAFTLAPSCSARTSSST